MSGARHTAQLYQVQDNCLSVASTINEQAGTGIIFFDRANVHVQLGCFTKQFCDGSFVFIGEFLQSLVTLGRDPKVVISGFRHGAPPGV
jgi:hypothetical protein